MTENQRELLLMAYQAWVSEFQGTEYKGKTWLHGGGGFQNGEINKGKMMEVAHHWDGACDCDSHWTVSKTSRKGSNGTVYESISSVPKKYAQVCKRERAWRHYISVRDSKDYYNY